MPAAASPARRWVGSGDDRPTFSVPVAAGFALQDGGRPRRCRCGGGGGRAGHGFGLAAEIAQGLKGLVGEEPLGRLAGLPADERLQAPQVARPLEVEPRAPSHQRLERRLLRRRRHPPPRPRAGAAEELGSAEPTRDLRTNPAVGVCWTGLPGSPLPALLSAPCPSLRGCPAPTHPPPPDRSPPSRAERAARLGCARAVALPLGLATGVFPEGENRGRGARAGGGDLGKSRSPG